LAGCTYDDVEYINSQGIYIKLKGEYNATY